MEARHRGQEGKGISKVWGAKRKGVPEEITEAEFKRRFLAYSPIGFNPNGNQPG